MLLTRLGTPKFIPVIRKDQGRRPAYANNGYGIPSVGIWTKKENTTVKISINDRGWRIAHAPPNIDCL